MRKIKWDQNKNESLKNQRGISFEEIVVGIENHQVLAIIENPSRKYKNQKVYIVVLNNYIYYVPFIKSEEGIFLKSIIPSRKLTKKYLKKEGGRNA